eukprot:452186_1
MGACCEGTVPLENQPNADSSAQFDSAPASTNLKENARQLQALVKQQQFTTDEDDEKQPLNLQHNETNDTDTSNALKSIEKDISNPLQDVSITCNKPFSACKSANRIKLILQQYDPSEAQLQDDTNNIINKIFPDTHYSYIDLLNDFHHIKYDHHTNDKTHEFDAFYEYLFANEDILKCEISFCVGATRHYTRRRYIPSVSATNDIKRAYGLNLVDRIHTYFVHSYDINMLTPEEIKYIENQMSECKDMNDIHDEIFDNKLQLITTILNKKTDTTRSIINSSAFVRSESFSKEICIILKNNDIPMDEFNLTVAFANYCYDKQQLMDDLCDIILNRNDDNTTISDILANVMEFVDRKQKQQLYDVILYKYFKKQQLDNTNFIKILQSTANELYPNDNWDGIEQIAVSYNLTGKVFIKDKENPDFKNSVKFGKIFNSMDNWDRKKWQTIYVTINKWSALKSSCTVYAPNTDKKNDLDDTDESIDFMDAGTDIDIINTFCVLTSVHKNTAIFWLEATHWNITFALNQYWSLNGDLSKIIFHPEDQHTDEKIDTDEKEKEIIYQKGIQFYYWKSQKSNETYIAKQFMNLKEEMLSFPKFTLCQWTDLVDECTILIETFKIKQISSNGNNADIYDIKQGQPFTLHHLQAVKLYTDYNWLFTVFTGAFRLRKISENCYERLESLKRRNQKVANLARLLQESVQSYGRLRVTSKKYYRGINKPFIFHKFITRFNEPLSTTNKFIVATQFAKGQRGIVMELIRYRKYVAGFNTSVVSVYDNEDEILFFGSDAIFKINSIFQWYNSTWASYRNYIDGIQNVLNIANGSIQWKPTNNMKDIIGYILPNLYFNNKQLPPYIQSLLNYHLKNLPNVIEYEFAEIIKQSQYE